MSNHSVQRKLFGGFKSNQTEVILSIAVSSHPFSVQYLFYMYNGVPSRSYQRARLVQQPKGNQSNPPLYSALSRMVPAISFPVYYVIYNLLSLVVNINGRCFGLPIGLHQNQGRHVAYKYCTCMIFMLETHYYDLPFLPFICYVYMYMYMLSHCSTRLVHSLPGSL